MVPIPPPGTGSTGDAAPAAIEDVDVTSLPFTYTRLIDLKKGIGGLKRMVDIQEIDSWVKRCLKLPRVDRPVVCRRYDWDPQL